MNNDEAGKALRAESAAGDVLHLRIAPELLLALRQMASLSGRAVSSEAVFHLDRAVFGPRELRLIESKKGKN